PLHDSTLHLDILHFLIFYSLFLSTATSPPNIYTLSLHDALPILLVLWMTDKVNQFTGPLGEHLIYIPLTKECSIPTVNRVEHSIDRKSTRLNSSHVSISYAVFCLKKKKKLGRALSKVVGCSCLGQ